MNIGNRLGDQRFVRLGDRTLAIDCLRISSLHVTHVNVSEVEDADGGGGDGDRDMDVDARSARGGLEGPWPR